MPFGKKRGWSHRAALWWRGGLGRISVSMTLIKWPSLKPDKEGDCSRRVYTSWRLSFALLTLWRQLIPLKKRKKKLLFSCSLFSLDCFSASIQCLPFWFWFANYLRSSRKDFHHFLLPFPANILQQNIIPKTSPVVFFPDKVRLIICS